MWSSPTSAANRSPAASPTDSLIEQAGGRAVYAEADVADEAACERLVATAVSRTGTLDVIVNNAVLAGSHSKALLETEPADWDAMMAVNLRGPYLLCRASVRQMLTQPFSTTRAAGSSTSPRSMGWSARRATSRTRSARAASCR